MVNGNDEGPQVVNVPGYSLRTCNGCKYFECKGVVFGHDFREDQTACLHPNVEKDFWALYQTKGKIIESRTRNHENRTPDWCPIAAQKT
jgi:hypothetical protein